MSFSLIHQNGGAQDFWNTRWAILNSQSRVHVGGFPMLSLRAELSWWLLRLSGLSSPLGFYSTRDGPVLPSPEPNLKRKNPVATILNHVPNLLPPPFPHTQKTVRPPWCALVLSFSFESLSNVFMSVPQFSLQTTRRLVFDDSVCSIQRCSVGSRQRCSWSLCGLSRRTNKIKPHSISLHNPKLSDLQASRQVNETPKIWRCSR